MKRYYGCCAVLAVWLVASVCQAQAYRLHVENSGRDVGDATAVCIGQTNTGNALLLTAAHNFADADSGRIKVKGDWHSVSDINRHKFQDVASFEVSAVQLRWLELGESDVVGQSVWLGGYGPEYWESGEPLEFQGAIGEKQFPDGGTIKVIRGAGGLHPITGDSGGPVTRLREPRKRELVGIVCGYHPTVRRSDRAHARMTTEYAGIAVIRECLSQRYSVTQCPPGGCPIYIRPEVRQPMVGIGIPIGPPQVVGVAQPAGVQYRPIDPGRPSVGHPGPAGPPRPAGPPGPAGRSVRKEEVETAVWTWLEANRESLKGDPGPAGPAGARGPAGNAADLDLSPVLSRLEEIESRRLRVMIVDGETKDVLDDETYEPGQPVVFDLRRFQRPAK